MKHKYVTRFLLEMLLLSKNIVNKIKPHACLKTTGVEFAQLQIKIDSMFSYFYFFFSG